MWLSLNLFIKDQYVSTYLRREVSSWQNINTHTFLCGGNFNHFIIIVQIFKQIYKFHQNGNKLSLASAIYKISKELPVDSTMNTE